MKPILTSHLLPTIEARLLELLRSLTGREWEAQTLAPAWKVKDVAAHLLDTQLRKLSRVRWAPTMARGGSRNSPGNSAHHLR